MKAYSFTINGNKYNVEIEDFEDNIAKVEVNGSYYEVEVHREIKTSKTPTLIRAEVPTSPHESKIKKSNKPLNKMIKSPLPGVIMQVFVKVGDQVKIDDKLLTYEAMKMENEILADRDGKIASIKVNVGESVIEGQELVEIV